MDWVEWAVGVPPHPPPSNPIIITLKIFLFIKGVAVGNTYHHNAPFCRRGGRDQLRVSPPFPYHLFWTLVHTDPDSQEPNPQSHGPCYQMFQVLSLPLLCMGIKCTRSEFLGQPTRDRVPIQCALGLYGWAYIMDWVEWAVGVPPHPPPSYPIIITP